MSEEAIQDTGSQEAVAAEPVAAEAVEVPFVETLAEHLRVPSTAKFKDANSMAQSYINLESMVGADKVAIPGKNATSDQWREVYTRLGAPEEAGGYQFEGDVPLDEAYIDTFREHAFNAGLNPSQANEMMGFIRSAVGSMNEAAEQGAEEARYNAEQELRQEFGQAFDQQLGLAQMAATHMLGGTEMFDEIRLENGMMLGDDPRIIRAFAEIATQIGEDNIVGDTAELIMTPEQAKAEADKMRMEEPYTKADHPQHQYYVEEVNRLYNLAFPDP